MMKRTGRVRWRSQHRLFGREELVLQVEWAGREPVNYGIDIGMEDRCYWRDASSEDMSGELLRGVGVLE